MADIGFDIPDNKKIRVIVDTDAACEADDPFAIVHALLSPKLIVKGVVAEHFNVPHSMEDSYNEIKAIRQAMAVDFPAFAGQTGPLSEDPGVSEGTKLIIKEALDDSSYPLFILCQGASARSMSMMMNSTAPTTHNAITPLTPGFLTSIFDTKRYPTRTMTP